MQVMGEDACDRVEVSSLAAEHLFLLYRFFDDLFPRMCERKYDGDRITADDRRGDFEEVIRKRLVSLGADREIEVLIRTLGCEKRRDMLRWYLGDARRNRDEASWTTPSVIEISRWLLTEDAVLVRTESDLKEAVLVSIERYQQALALDGRFVLDCWERQGGANSYRPILEEDLSARIANHLEADLRSVIVSREEQIRLGVRRGRSDITISTIVSGRPLTVILEHKRAQNPEVADGMRGQLIDRYLKPTGCCCGIYLVSWFDGFEASAMAVKNCLGITSLREAAQSLGEQAAECCKEANMEISAFVLNCASPDPNPPET